MSEIILASASPRRRKLLEQIDLPFQVHSSSVDEAYDAHLTPREVASELALRKARDVASNYENALIIGADTIVVYQNKIMEKPADKNEAEDMLQTLSGNTHMVLTGVALCKTGSNQNITDIHSFVEETEVTFGKLHAEDIKTYVEGGSPMDKAGGYGIQDDFGAIFVEKINGDYYNVVGFPLHRFYNSLYDFAPEVLSKVGKASK